MSDDENMSDDKKMTEGEVTVLDRLVDGELSPGERQQVLRWLDMREDGWRRCALAFLEAQTWGHQFKQLIADPADGKVVAAPSVEEASPGLRSSGRLAYGWLAVAAGLLLAFTFGRSMRPRDSSNSRSPQLAAIDQQENRATGELPDGLVPDDDSVTLLVRDVSGKNRRFQVPLMDVAAVNERFGNGQVGLASPATRRAGFNNRGFDLERRRRYAPMFFLQNEQLVPMVVPVDDTYIVPVSRPVY